MINAVPHTTLKTSNPIPVEPITVYQTVQSSLRKTYVETNHIMAKWICVVMASYIKEEQKVVEIVVESKVIQ
jgi:hypothetical protein